MATAHEENARIHFDLGANEHPVEISEVALQSLPDGRLLDPTLPPRRYFVSYSFNELGCRGADYP